MPAGWRTVRVFISSTFRDMQAERDHLVRFVFPRLREELLRRRIHLVDVDLRWGVTAEQDALEVCREIINECRPRFICILGGRYGWTPPGQERSITADEVHYAALDRLDVAEYRCFYFRDPAATESIPEDAARAGAYRELATAEDIEKYGRERAAELARERKAKLADLKQRVRAAGLPVFTYPARWDESRQRLVGLEAFGEAVYHDLLASIDDEFGAEAPEALDWFAEESAAMEAFIEERTERYVVGSRQALLDEMAAFAEGAGEPSVLVVTGEPGSGKSALLGRFYRDYAEAHPQEIVVPHFVGASQGSTSIRLTLRRLCHELAQAAGIEDETPEDIRELVQAFPDFLGRAAGGRRVLLIIDALNQLDATDNAHSLNWLPRALSEGVRVICSSLEQPPLEALRRRTGQVREALCSLLTGADAAAIMDGVLARYRKRFDEAQRQALLAKADAGNPLYLLAALEELRTLGTYELITARIEELPGTVTGLFDWILQRLAEGIEGQEAFGEDLVSAYTSYIAIGRGGMTEGELEALCAPVDDEGEFQVLHRMLRPYLMRRGELVDYFHGQLREAVERRCLPDKATRRQRHREIAEHLQSRGYEYPRTLSELPYHLTHGAMWDELEAALTDLAFIERKCAAGMRYDLVQDYGRVGAGRGQPGPPIRTAWRHEGRLGVWCPFCLAWSELQQQHLGAVIACPDCASPIQINRFVIAAQWRPHTPRRSTASARPLAAPALSRGADEFADFVHAQAHVLGTWPHLTLQQALNWPDGLAPSEVARAEVVTRESSRARLRWLNKPCRLDPCIAVLEGHGAEVNACSSSPDGWRIASGSADGTVRVWDALSGEQLARLQGHGAEVRACSFSPDGRRVLSGYDDRTVRVWDAESGDELARFEGHGDWTLAHRFAPNAPRTVLSSGDGRLRVWDAESGEELAQLGRGGGVSACGFSPDGQRIVCGSWDGRVCVLDADSGEQVVALQWLSYEAQTALSFSPDGRCIIGATNAFGVLVWDAESGERLFPQNLGYRILACCFSPDGQRIAAGSRDGTVGVWDAERGAQLARLEGHGGAVSTCGFSPDGQRLVSGSWDTTVRVWQAESGEEPARPAGHGDAVLACGFSPDGRRIVSGSADYKVRVWQAEGGQELVRMGGHLLWANACSFSADGRRIVSGSSDRSVRLWHAGTGDELACLMGHTGGVWACSFSPDGRRIASGSRDRTVRVWDAESGEELARLGEHGGRVNSCSFSPDGGRIISGCEDGRVHAWVAHSGEELTRLEGHSGAVCACSFSPDGSHIISGSSDRSVRLWEPESGKELARFQGHSRKVCTCSFSPDGRSIVSGSADSTLRVWEAESGEEGGIFPAGVDVLAAAWDPSGERLVAGDRLGRLHLLSLEGLEAGPPVLTVTRLWLFGERDPLSGMAAPGRWDDKLTAPCPFHGERFEVTETMIGTEIACPECGQRLRLNPFVCDNSERCL